MSTKSNVTPVNFRPSPRRKPTRLERMAVRITMDERAEFQRLASESGRSVSDLVRDSVLGQGVSRRDWFAGQALLAIIPMYRDSLTYAEYAVQAFDYADAMMSEGRPTPPTQEHSNE